MDSSGICSILSISCANIDVSLFAKGTVVDVDSVIAIVGFIVVVIVAE
jgi:hypothetical protein